jgi:hypothetical protein
MKKTSISILRFDNYPEAKLALGKVKSPCLIKPYECDDPQYHFYVDDYGRAVQTLYDAFEYSRSNWVEIETY